MLNSSTLGQLADEDAGLPQDLFIFDDNAGLPHANTSQHLKGKYYRRYQTLVELGQEFVDLCKSDKLRKATLGNFYDWTACIIHSCDLVY